MYDAVLSYHTNPWTCGVAKLADGIAKRLKIPFWSLFSPHARSPLVHLKASELSATDTDRLMTKSPPTWWQVRGYDLFLHEWLGTELERALAALARRIYAPNASIAKVFEGDGRLVETFCPQTLAPVPIRHGLPELTVFVCGMAHKILAGPHKRLAELLDQTGQTYHLDVSVAFHARIPHRRAMDALAGDLRGIYGDRVAFLGYISDYMVYRELTQHDFCALFYPHGLLANNTMAQAVLRFGPVLVTNLGPHSPDMLRHGEHLIDITRDEPLLSHDRTAIRANAYAVAKTHYSWTRFLEDLR